MNSMPSMNSSMSADSWRDRTCSDGVGGLGGAFGGGFADVDVDAAAAVDGFHNARSRVDWGFFRRGG